MNKIEINLDLITQEMDELKDLKARYEFELKQVKEKIEKNELKLISLLNQTGVKEMSYGCYSFNLKIIKRQSLDQKLLKEKYPEQYNDCYITKENEKFEFKINK